MPASARAAPKAGLVHEMVEIVKTIVYALLIALVLKVIVFQPYTIPSASEEPNLYEGDYIIVSKWSYGWSRHSIPFSPPIFSGRILFHQPERGDIVVFKLPRDGNTDYIKRLVGLPGDTIQVKGGKVFINGQALARLPLADGTGDLPDGNDLPVLRFDEQMPNGRQHVIQKAPTGSQADNTGVYVVPPHCYFMIGDNRDNSLDSRFDPGLSARRQRARHLSVGPRARPIPAAGVRRRLRAGGGSGRQGAVHPRLLEAGRIAAQAVDLDRHPTRSVLPRPGMIARADAVAIAPAWRLGHSTRLSGAG